jgi:hypothetical protein
MNYKNIEIIIKFCYQHKVIQGNMPLAHDINEQIYVNMLDSNKYKLYAKKEAIDQAVILLKDRIGYLATLMNASKEPRYNLSGSKSHLSVTRTEASEALLRFSSKIKSAEFSWECA